MKKVICLSLAIMLLLSLALTGCGKASDPQVSGDNKTTEGQDTAIQTGSTEADTSQSWFHKYEEEVVLTRNARIIADAKYAEGDDAENNPYTRWAKNEIGIVYKQKWSVPDGATDIQKLNLAMASNDLPDIISLSAGDLLSKMIQANILTPINKLIDEYGSPLTKYMINSYQESLDGNFFALFTKKDDYYAFPEAADVFGANYNGLWIRKDVLDTLGKQVPETLEQFEDILAAYKESNPEGIGFVYNSIPIMNAHGAFPKKWVKDDDGSLIYGSIRPEVKEALATLNKWYKNGWLDKEYFVKDFTKSMEPFLAGNGLAVYGQWWYPSWPLPDVWKNVPTAEIVPVQPLKGTSGKQAIMYDMKNGYFDSGIAINAKCKNPEALVYMLNEHLDSQYRHDKDLRDKMKKEYNYDFKYPYETVKTPTNPDAPLEEQKWDYQKEGPGYFNIYHGNPVHHFFGFKFNQAPAEMYNTIMVANNAYKNNTVEALKDEDIVSYQWIKSWDTNNKGLESIFKLIDLYNFLKDQPELFVYNQFTSSSTITMVDKGAYLDKLESETFAKIIIGEKPIDEFEKFVEEWKKAGGNEVTNEVNEWYQANK